MSTLTFNSTTETFSIKLNRPNAHWLVAMLQQISITNPTLNSLQEVKENYEAAGFDDFELFWDNKPVNTLYKAGLLQL